MLRLWLIRIALAAITFFALRTLQNALPHLINDYIFDVMMLAGINIILAVSLNLINGITGQFSLGHAGFMAIGAYVAASFTRYAAPRLVFDPNINFALALICGAIAAGFAGFLIGLPSLRLKGDYLAIVTLGFGQIVIAIIVTIKEVGGALGMSDIPARTNFMWLGALIILCILTVRNLAYSSFGRAMRAVREDEIAAEAAGINTTQTKVLAFVISSAWAGIGGGLLVHYLPSFDPDTFSFLRSVEVVVMVVLGGLGSITGATLAAILLKVMEESLRSVVGAFWVGLSLIALGIGIAFPLHRSTLNSVKGWIRWLRGPVVALAALILLFRYGRHWIESPDTPGNAADWLRYVIYALILIVLMLLRPQGLLGRGEIGWNWLRKRRAERLKPQVAGNL